MIGDEARKAKKEIKSLRKWEQETLARMKVAADAAKAKGLPTEEVLALEQDFLFDARSFADRIEVIESQQLVSEAVRHSLPVPSKSESSEDWYYSTSGGGWLLSQSAFVDLRKAIREEEKFHREKILGWAAAATGIIGALTGLVAVAVQFF